MHTLSVMYIFLDENAEQSVHMNWNASRALGKCIVVKMPALRI